MCLTEKTVSLVLRMATCLRVEKARTLKLTGIVRALQSQLEPTFCLELFHRGEGLPQVLCHFGSGQDSR